MAPLGEVGVDAHLEVARSRITELEALASRHGMRELLVTTAALRARLGVPTALDTAALAAQGIDNPTPQAPLSSAIRLVTRCYVSSSATWRAALSASMPRRRSSGSAIAAAGRHGWWSRRHGLAA